MYFGKAIDGDAMEQKFYAKFEFIAYLGTNKCPFCFHDKPIIRTHETPDNDIIYQYCRNCHEAWEVEGGNATTGFTIKKVILAKPESDDTQ